MIVVADNLQITHPVVQSALRNLNPDPLKALVRRMETAGARMIDINTGPLGKGAEEKMTFLVQAVEEATRLPLIMDTANPVAMAAGVKAAQKRVTLNGFSLEPRKLKHILPLAAQYEADIIGYLLDAQGRIPPTADERLTLAVEVHQACLKAGVPQERLIVDPVVAPLLWEDGQAQNRVVLKVIQSLPGVLGYEVRTVAGLSNLTAGTQFSDKQAAMECAYGAMLAASGLHMILVNIFHQKTVRVLEACDALLSEKVFTWET
ncbi:MAG: dihydropteroate synthase [Deltaproteobacteria bacterium]|nr:dihydropteroate synthase [Deltaproteobacteria bacterium]